MEELFVGRAVFFLEIWEQELGAAELFCNPSPTLTFVLFAVVLLFSRFCYLHIFLTKRFLFTLESALLAALVPCQP